MKGENIRFPTCVCLESFAELILNHAQEIRTLCSTIFLQVKNLRLPKPKVKFLYRHKVTLL